MYTLCHIVWSITSEFRYLTYTMIYVMLKTELIIIYSENKTELIIIIDFSQICLNLLLTFLTNYIITIYSNKTKSSRLSCKTRVGTIHDYTVIIWHVNLWESYSLRPPQFPQLFTLEGDTETKTMYEKWVKLDEK